MYSYSSSKSQNLKRRRDENTTGDGLDLTVGDLQQISTSAKSQTALENRSFDKSTSLIS